MGLVSCGKSPTQWNGSEIWGEDQDESVMANTSVANGRTTDFAATTIQVPVIDVYDPRTDTQVALENARKVFPSIRCLQLGKPGRDGKIGIFVQLAVRLRLHQKRRCPGPINSMRHNIGETTVRSRAAPLTPE